jgi:magnesium transporter
VPIVDESMVPYFADVHGHLLRIHDWLETYRDQVSSLVDLQISLQSHRLNETMRTLTAWSIILMACGLIAGIYGMNFAHMPELRWLWGYPFAIGLMLSVTGMLVLFFRRWGWWKS